MNQNFGMMDEGYFISRSEILNWINELLKLNVAKIEQLGQGSVYCQILDSMYQNQIPMHKVNFSARLEYEFISNLKVFQQSCEKVGIKKVIDIEKLSKCKYQDNLEMIQWLKRYYDYNHNNKNDTYDPIARRKNQSLIQDQGTKKQVKAQTSNSTKTNDRKTLNKENFFANQQSKPVETNLKSNATKQTDDHALNSDKEKSKNFDKIVQILQVSTLDKEKQLEQIKMICQICEESMTLKEVPNTNEVVNQIQCEPQKVEIPKESVNQENEVI